MKVISNNKKAFFDFFVSDLVEAGIVLEGCEVKSVRDGGASLTDSFVIVKNGEMFLKNAYIKPYEKTSSFKPDERRTRKLLLNKSEILKFERMSKEKGFSIVATKLFINERGKVKVEIGLAKGKKLYDKRQTLKEKVIKRDIERYQSQG
ncbi:MAG: SsrA-binding protein SmpB [Clostridia bacterium]|nr:SsrA-binding protein SmpB [Clostridia bacterium]